MYSHRASALFFCLTNALLVYKGALSLEAQPETSGATERDHQRTLGRTANDDEVLKNILPLVTFDCLGKNGYFADKKFDCEVFHYCDPNGSRSTFHCPNNFFFNSELMVCEQMTENKKGLCWKNEDEDHKQKKPLGKISDGDEKKNIEKSSTKFKASPPDDLDHVSSDVSLSFSEQAPQMDGMMTLEDVLSYMNADSNPGQPKTFISTFLKTSGDRSTKALVNTSVINPFKKLKGHASDSSRSHQDVEIQKTSPKQVKAEVVSDMYEGKQQKRKRGRRGGRTLGTEESWSETRSGRHHSHVSARSPADDYVEEKKIYDRWEDQSSSIESSSPSSSGSLRLFDIESRRNSTDPWRKRRRPYRRRRKNKNHSSSTTLYENSPDNTTDVYGQTTSKFLESHRTKGKKSDLSEWQRSTPLPDYMKPQISTSFKVSFLKDENEPNDRDSQPMGTNEGHSSSEITANTNTEPNGNVGSNQNPWFKSTLPAEDDNNNFRFGERTTTASGTGFAPEPFYGDENGSVVSNNFFNFEDKPDRSSFNQNTKIVPDVTQRPKLKFGKDRRVESPRRGNIKVLDRRPVDEEQKDSFWNQDSTKERQKKVSDGHFQHSTDKIKRPTSPKKLEHEWSSQWSPIVSEVTTLSPPPALPLKAAFSDSHEPSIGAVMEDDGIRWKQRETSERRNKPKVPVGSSYKQWKEEPKLPPPDSPKLNTTPAARAKKQEKNSATQHRNVHRDRKKEWPKQTLAHQHLSKVMNDFLAIPPVNLGLPKPNYVAPSKTFETFVPKYRIPNEDIYVSESIPKETFKNQKPDIFEIVDLISKHSIGKPKEIAMPNNDGSDAHRVTIKDALMSVKSINENKEKIPSSDIEIVDLRETLEDLFNSGVDKIIGKDHSMEYDNDRDTPRIIKGSIKKITELSQEEQEELKEITEIAKFTSLRLKPLLTSVLRQTSKELSSEASKTTAERTPLQPTIITAKKLSLRDLFADDDTSKESTPKPALKRPAGKVVRNRSQASRLKMMRHPPPIPTPAMPIMVLHPPSLRPPHPPPLYRRYPYPLMHMPYGGIRPMLYHQHYPYIPRRRKRSPQFLKRIGSYRWNYSPFAHGVMPSLGSNHGSSLFRRPFVLHRFPTSSLPNPFRFRYALAGNTGLLRPRKPRLRKPVFLPRQPIRNIPQPVRNIPQPVRNIPQPVRHISQAVRNIAQPVRTIPHAVHNIPQPAHQTVIIEEVPIPIPVEVPHLPPSRVPALSSIRVPETLRPQRPSHVQDSRGHSAAFPKPAQFHQAPFPFSIGLIETPKPRSPSITYSQPVKTNPGTVRPPPSREPKFQLNSPVSQNSLRPSPPSVNSNSNRNTQNRPVNPNPPVILTQTEFPKRPPTPQFAFPFDTKNLHVKSYPNYSYFHTGPPTSFSDFLSPYKEKPKNSADSSSKKEPPKPPVVVSGRPSSSRPVKPVDSKYKGESGSRPSTPSSVSITSSPGGLFVVSPPDSSAFPKNIPQNNQNTQSDSPVSFSWSEESKESLENGISNQRPQSSLGTSSKERKVRRRRPGGRRRRPRPNVVQGLGNSTSRDADQSDIKTTANIWKIASPPQQIPPPPSEITTQMLNTKTENENEGSTNKNVPTNVPTTSDPNVSGEKSAFPPAGYYGSEQLSQLLETFSVPIQGINSVASLDYSTEVKLPSLSTTEQPGEESSLFSQEESTFYEDLGDGRGRVPFGTRLKAKPGSRANLRQNAKPQNESPDVPKVVRHMQPVSPPQNRYRGSSYHEPGSQSSDMRDTVQPPSRIKPDRSRYPGPGGRPTKDPRGIRPEVIYYDTREHPDGLFKIEGDAHNSKPPSPVLVRTHEGTRDMFHLPNPYSDRDLFGLNPPSTPRPVISSNGFHGIAPLRGPPREKPDFVIPRRPHMDHSPVGSPSLSHSPRLSGFRQTENTQQQYRVRERKRPTVQPKPKNEVRTSSLNFETTTVRPYSPPTQITHKTKETHKTPEYPYFQHKQETSVSPKDAVTPRWTIKTTTTSASVTMPESIRSENIVTTVPPEHLETKSPIEKSSGFIPVRGIPKTMQAAKLDLSKINATISTSVSVSSSSNGNHVSSAEASSEGQPKKVFSSKNGGLAVVRKGTRQRKRNRNRQRTTAIPKIESTPSRENGLNDDEKLQIAASIQDIIKATAESERVQETQPPATSQPANLTTLSSKVSKKWILQPPEDVSQAKNAT